MTSRRTFAVIVALVIPVGVLAGIRVAGKCLRYGVVQKLMPPAPARQRASIRPTNRTMPAAAPVQPINLGYATFDAGVAFPFSIETTSSEMTVLLKSSDLNITLLRLFASAESSEAKPAEVTAQPSAHSKDKDPLAVLRKVEETQPLPFQKTFWMSDDDFLLYFTYLSKKAANRFGFREVRFFAGPNVRGIAEIGKSATDTRFALAYLVSPDGTRQVGCRLEVPNTSPNDIFQALDSILGSFRFTVDSVADPARVKALILEAGIRPQAEAVTDDAAH